MHRVVKEQTARDLSGMLEQVVVAGTARHAVKLTGYTAAGKTGTPQKVDPITKRYSKTKFMPTFAGFVPASNPRFAIIVVLDEPIGLHQGGQVSAPVFARIAESALLDYGISPDSPEFRESLGVLIATLRDQIDRSGQSNAEGDLSDSLPAAASALPRAETSSARRADSTTVSLNVAEQIASPRPPLGRVEIDPRVMPDFRGAKRRRSCKALSPTGPESQPRW
jgi:cell division protein FtsI (penicillin-binding protein 3)